MPNRLARSRSLYLRQHADNPVEWHEWGDEAFALARAKDRPLLLSVGYSACHWCHVMAHESFSDPGIAARMNEGFVNVKVDREERPDVDAVYMDAVNALTGRGGWPMTLFLTPEGEPFYGGTYYPPEPRHGLPGFVDVLDAVSTAWRDRRPEIVHMAAELAAALRRAAQWSSAREPIGIATVDRGAAVLLASIDRTHGGFGDAPKFPQASALLFLLGRYARTGQAELWEALATTLGAMARGGIRDHVGGGFHRYAVDARWRVPHFEKMLYDNALLGRLYIHAWQLTRSDSYRRVAESTLDYLLAELRSPEGGFYASQDADTPEGEGAYYRWDARQVEAILPADESAIVLRWFGLDEETAGDAAGVLHEPLAPEVAAKGFAMSVAELEAVVSRARVRMAEGRSSRRKPETDRKRIVAWNGLAADALARAGAALGRADYVQAAESAALALMERASPGTGLVHAWDDGPSPVPAFQEDYAALATACISLYEATFDARWLDNGRALADEMVELFWDARDGGFYRLGPRHERLLVRQKELVDSAMPSGNALAADALLRLASLYGSPDDDRLVAGILRVAAPTAERAPAALGALLGSFDDFVSGRREIALVAPSRGPAMDALLEVARGRFLPGTVLAAAFGSGRAGVPPILAGRGPVGGAATAYVCRGHVCRAPVTDPASLAAELDAPGESTALP